ncbi:MAG: DMT family transporter [SAR324 cluster bacterium]|nr:DMT family transporter [SAR324 cluster bacterium]
MFEGLNASSLFAVSAATMFGLTAHAIKRGIAHVDPQTASVVSIATTLLCFLVFAPFWIDSADWNSSAIPVFAVIGLIQPAISRYFAYEANRRVGPTISATFTAVTPLIAAVIAITFLGESLSLGIAMGTLITVAGILTISWNFQGAGTMLRGALLFALATSTIRALTANMGRYGMTVLPNPLMGALVAFSVSLLVGVSIYIFQKKRLPGGIPKVGIFWCGVAGVISAIAVIFLYSALLYGSVLTVSPILATAPIFTLIFAFLFRVDSPTRRTVFGVVFVVIGVVIVILRPGG